MILPLDTIVKIVGNDSQGVRHYADIGQKGHVSGHRNGMIIRNKLKKVKAYYVSVGSARWVVSHEDLEVI